MPDDTPAPVLPPSEPPPARWPGWFHTLDVTAATVVLAAAFLAASFAARTSLTFLHLAGGRALATGQLTPGGDPFSHAGAAGRPWADTHWLFDLAAYALYSADASGAALVAVKAVGVAVALGLLLLLRKPGRPLFPWVLGLALAAVAAADQVRLESVTASVLFLAATLVLLHRLDWTRPGWRNPLLLGGLFLLWANTDAWFLLGPVVAAAVWLGGKFDGTPRPGLGRGLLVGVAACLLNPFALAAVAKSPAEVIQLVPWEFGLYAPAGLDDDPQLGNNLLRPLSTVILDRATAGDDLNLPALGVLALFAVVGTALSRSVAAGLLTALGLAVGLLNLRLAPLAAVLLVPAVGWGLNHAAGWVTGGRADDPKVRIRQTISGLGRFLLLLAGLGIGVAAYPGWLHPPRTDPAFGKVYTQRVEWAVEADPSLARTATQLTDWPADRKGLAVGPDVANYAAWFAPGVRQFVNTRYGFHRADLPDLLLLRAATLGRRDAKRPTEPADLDDAAAACDRQGGGYLVVTSVAPPRRVDEPNPATRQLAGPLLLGLGQPDRWTLWHLDGRSVVLGRGPGGPAYDPVAAAFRPGEPIPAGPTGPLPLPPADDLIVQAVDQARNPLRPPAAEADDALAIGYHLSLLRRQADFEFQRQAVFPRLGLLGGLGVVGPPPPRPPSDVELALPVLAVRAARRGVAAAPDRPEPYRAVLAAYSLPQQPVFDAPTGLLQQILGMSEVDAQQVTAATRFLARLPATPPSFELRVAGFETAVGLAERYETTNQLDLARAAVEKAADLLKRVPSAGGKDDPLAAERKQLEAREESLSSRIQRQQRAAERATDPAGRVMTLIEAGLPGKALEAMSKGDATTFGPAFAGLALRAAQAELRAGRLEDATARLDALDDAVRAAPEQQGGMADQVRALRAVTARLAGDPRAAAGPAPGPTPVVPPGEARRLQTVLQAAPGLAAAAGVAAGGLAQIEAGGRLQGLAEAVLAEASRQADRGLLALLDGDPTEAGRRLDAALTPFGLPLAEFNPPLADRIGRYRALVRRHAGK